MGVVSPPDLCGLAAVPAPLRDPRWLAVRDQRALGLRYRGEGIAAKVDKWVNYAVRYERDDGDSWAPPAETLAKLAGDCEDIALLKRALLINSGVPEPQIMFVLAYDLLARADHAFLVVFEARWLALENRNSLTMPAERLRDYRPIEAFTRDRAWTFGRRR